MPENNNIQAAGDYNLGEVAIMGSSGTIVNITEQVQELNIFQSIDSPFMSGNIMINDAMGVASVLPILGQERLLFTFRTPGSFPIDFDTYNAVILTHGSGGKRRYHNQYIDVLTDLGLIVFQLDPLSVDLSKLRASLFSLK